ncbi:hypothetical protein AB1K70_12005 [Bremerella sp. JC770]|uniref:hypothetical protein n=1 Tax=Bremerella sp. JC770 TaxID=3232137 RepID=UPI00345978D6
MRFPFCSLIVLCTAVLLVGCSSTSSGDIPAPPSPTDGLQRDLDYIVEHKMVGSELINIQENIERLSETDPDKAEQLRAEFKKLDKAQGARAAAIARKMIDLL